MLPVLLKSSFVYRLNVKFCKLSVVLSRTMSSKEIQNVLKPPAAVRGMTELNREAFLTKIRVPRLIVKARAMEKVLKQVKPFMLKMTKLQPVSDYSEEERKSIILNPNLVSDESNLFKSDSTTDVLKEADAEFSWDEVELKYDNWKSEDIFDAVLPEELDKTAGYSRIGHIIHLNLRDHLKDYRFLIGQVLLDKLSGVRSVVNKLDTIESEYRNFKMEVLAGDEDMFATVKEIGCTYEFDFSQVFWNPRLSTEHERIVSILKKNDSVLYDVFAGVGPFAIPAAKFRKSIVLANDLNPNSFRWLQHNIKVNKVEKRVQAFNIDAREFIRTIVKRDLISRWATYTATREDQSVSWPEIHFVMNLPSLAVEFLDSFIGLLSDEPQLESNSEFVTPTIHCYLFIKDSLNLQEPVLQVESVLQKTKLNSETTSVSFVRKVAPNKEMMKISFKLPRVVLFRTLKDDDDACESLPKSKRTKLQ